MKTNSMFRLLPALLLMALCLVQTGFGQTTPAPKKVYSEVYYHKLKPGHTFAEANAIENEFKKLHQAQANDGFILGWYMLALDMTTNPNKEYSYITIKNFTDPGLMDDAYPQKYFTSVMGTDYQTKVTDLYKRMGEVKEVAKVEIWEHIDGAQANPAASPGKAPVWMVTNFKVKNGQHAEYMARVKQASPFNRDLVATGGAAGWNFAGLALPSATEKAYDYSSVYQLTSMKALLDTDQAKAEAAFKKTMPGVDYKQFYKEMSDLREAARQEIYYLVEYAVKAPTPAVRLAQKVLDSYVGIYEGSFAGNPKATFTVTRDGNQLFEELTGGRKLEITPETETKFVFNDMDARLEFIRDASGKVVKRTLTTGGQTSEAKKIK